MNETPIGLDFVDIDDLRAALLRYGQHWADADQWPGSEILDATIYGRAFVIEHRPSTPGCDPVYTVRVLMPDEFFGRPGITHAVVGRPIRNAAQAVRVARALSVLSAHGFVPYRPTLGDRCSLADVAARYAERLTAPAIAED